MNERTIVFLTVSEPEQSELAGFLQIEGIEVQTILEGRTALNMARMNSPALIICAGKLPDMHASELAGFLEADPALHSCAVLLIDQEPPVRENTHSFLLDWMPPGETEAVVIWRVQKLLQLQKCAGQMHKLHQDHTQLLAAADRNSAAVEETTAELVEMAAQLQAEICRNTELEAEHLQMVRRDTLAQAAAALRHEINNPLFAISGSAQLLLSHLPDSSEKEVESMRRSLSRVLLGAERIGEVVQAISAMLDPELTNYAEGVQMLNLGRKPAA